MTKEGEVMSEFSLTDAVGAATLRKAGREVAPLWYRALEAIASGIVYALGLWLLFTVFGEPSFAKHHLTDFLQWVGIVYAVGTFTSRDAALHFPGTRSIRR